MNAYKRLCLEYYGIKSVIGDYTQEGTVVNFLEGLGRKIEEKDIEAIIYYLEQLNQWYEKRLNSIKEDFYVDNYEEHLRVFNLISELLSSFNSSQKGEKQADEDDKTIDTTFNDNSEKKAKALREGNYKIKYQIFVSSTYEDLIEERKEITQAILEADCIPAGMELFPASNESQWDFIKKIIDESDFYLVVIAGRYGSEGKDDFGKKVGYTEMEFDYAVRTNKPIIALIHSNPNSLPKNKCEKTTVKEAKLRKFREKISTGRLIKNWTNKDDLKSAALAAIYSAKKTNGEKALGWIRCDDLIRRKLIE